MERTPLEAVQIYLGRRRAGTTSAALAGLSYDRPFLFMVANRNQAMQILMSFPVENRRVNGPDYFVGNMQIITISDIRRLQTFNKPLILDHFALDQLIIQHTASINKYWRDKYEPGWQERYKRELQPPMHDSFSSDLAANPPEEKK